LKRFTADTEEKTRVPERTIRREIQIVKDIPNETRDAIRDMPLADSKTDLLDLAKLDPEEQREVVDEILKAPPSRKSEARQVKQVVKRIRESRKAVALEEAPEAIVQDTDSWEIRHGDCLEVLPTIARGSVRLAFADPPYNIGVDYGEGHDDVMSPGDFRAWTVRWIRELAATLTPDGSMWVLINHEWGKDVETAICEAGLTVRDWVTWYETFGDNCTNKFNRTSRRLFHAVKDPKRFVLHREAVTRPSDRQAIYNDRRANPKGKIWDDVWGIKPPIPRLVGNANERIPEFPTQLPLALLRPIVACASDRGDRVLDPFNGSGTTGVAAISMGRRYLGIERSQSFLQRSRQRLLSTQRSFFDVY
jgi:site-specific DNA-methyltransferase (adenine-specific)